MSKHIVKSTTVEHRDQETGEIFAIETEKTFNVKVKGDHFFQTYVGLLAPFYGLEHLSDTKLIVKLCELADFNTGGVSISSARRATICEELKINSSNFSKYMARLKKKELISGDKGEYIINPTLYWKGEAKVREQFRNEQPFRITVNMEKE